MTERVLGERGSKRRKRFLVLPVLATAAFALAALAISGGAVAQTASCNNTATLGAAPGGSAFEIDADANLVVNTTGCIDWKSVTHFSKADLQSGTGDDSFGQGTSESEPNPTIVAGSIPPNKSDLKNFGIYKETAPGGKFLELYWARVQNPNGTTNMDFELNKIACDGTADNCANNAPQNKPAVYVTPKRSNGDKLITYDLSKGGTVPTISIRTWNSGAWGAAVVISGGSNPDALGSVNTSTIDASNTPPEDNLGSLSPYTFGEVAIDFDAIFGSNECGSFGSVYLKSRSSDSFTSELKDFIRPENVFISNCSSITTTATPTANLGAKIKDTATLADVTADAGGSIEFNLYGPSDTPDCSGDPIFTDTNSSIDGPGDYDSAEYEPLAPGTYYWTADYSGDSNNSPSSSECGDEGEASVISRPDSTISTEEVLVPNDSATIGGGGTLDGTATFALFAPDQECSAASSDTPVYTEDVSVSGSADQTVSTGNGDDTDDLAGSHADALGTWGWVVTYHDDSTHNDSVSDCTETFTIDE